MKNVVEEMGFPQDLVSLRHQAVHKSRDGTLLSPGVIEYAMKELQQFINDQYWEPLAVKIKRRDSNYAEFKQKVADFTVVYDTHYKMPQFAEM